MKLLTVLYKLVLYVYTNKNKISNIFLCLFITLSEQNSVIHYLISNYQTFEKFSLIGRIFACIRIDIYFLVYISGKMLI